jgi:HEAT repeat protein
LIGVLAPLALALACHSKSAPPPGPSPAPSGPLDQPAAPGELDAEIGALGDAHSAWEQEAVRRIEARGPAVVPRLLRELDADRLGGVGRARILTLLGGIGAPEGLPAVLAGCGDRLPGVRAAAIDAASAFRDPRATVTLIRLLDDPDRDVVVQAELRLGERRDQAAVPRLGALLDSPDQGIRYGAARALFRTATPEARSLLRRRLDHETDAEVRAAITSGPAE